jgi:hypothetical protein
VKNVSFVIPEKQQHQIRGMINYYLVSNDPEIEKYLTRLAVTIKSIKDYYDIDSRYHDYRYKPINRSPYGRFKHGKNNPNEVGFLKAPLSDYIARNIDKSNRLVAFELDKGVIGLVNVIGHYEQNVFNETGYIEQAGDDLTRIYRRDKQEYLAIKDSSEFLLDTLFSCVDTKEMKPGEYNEDCQSAVFPTGLDTIADLFKSSGKSIHDNISKPDKKSSLEREWTKLDNLDNDIYRTLRNICNLSYFIAKVSGDNELSQMEDLVKTNDKTISKFMNLLKSFNDDRDVFRCVSDAIDKNLQACKKALDHSFSYSIDSETIASFVSVFKDEVDLDIKEILNKSNLFKGNVQNNDLQFKNTTILLEELTSALTKQQPLYILNKEEMQISDKVIYFNVPHEEREQAKALGAKWNINAHCWYVPKGINVKPFDEKGWQRVNPKDIEKSIQEKKERDSFRSMLNSESKEKVIERKQEVQSVKKGRSR